MVQNTGRAPKRLVIIWASALWTGSVVMARSCHNYDEMGNKRQQSVAIPTARCAPALSMPDARSLRFTR